MEQEKSYVLTPVFRVSYPNIFKAKLNTLSNKEEYGCAALFAKGENLQVLEKAVLKALVDKLGAGSVVKGPPHKNGVYYFKTAKGQVPVRLPFRDQGEQRLDKDGNEKDIPNGYEAGAKYINIKSYKPVQLVDQKRNPIIDETVFYAGCYAIAAINASYYDQKGNRGVSFWVQAIQKVKDGETLTNRVNPLEAFAPIEDESSEASADSLF